MRSSHHPLKTIRPTIRKSHSCPMSTAVLGEDLYSLSLSSLPSSRTISHAAPPTTEYKPFSRNPTQPAILSVSRRQHRSQLMGVPAPGSAVNTKPLSPLIAADIRIQIEPPLKFSPSPEEQVYEEEVDRLLKTSLRKPVEGASGTYTLPCFDYFS